MVLKKFEFERIFSYKIPLQRAKELKTTSLRAILCRKGLPNKG